jgi:ABC-type Fe3+/spermidine/putrescine transport system ATPase subunit
VIEVEGLSKQYAVGTGPVHALQDVNLRVGTAERLGLFGPSGSGKTTLLRCIAGLEAPEKGVITIDRVEVYNAESGLNMAPWMRPIGVVFQDYALWPHMRVLDNVLFPLRYGRANVLSKTEQRERASYVLKWVRLEGFEGRYPTELSGGQRQRVALARALVSEPSVLLMDEPLSSLDPHLRKQTRNELVEILERAGITTIFVSHDHVDGLFMTNTVGIMRDGRLVQVGAPRDVFMQPIDASVAETLDVGAVIACRMVCDEKDVTRLHLPECNQYLKLPQDAAGDTSGGSLFILIRRDACQLWNRSVDSRYRQKLVGRVVREGYTGRGWCVLVNLAATTIEVWERERPGVKHGDIVELAVDMQRVQLLTALPSNRN